MTDSVDYKKNNLKALRADVDETTHALKVTVDKLVDRGDRLDVLSAKANDLNASSVHFHGSTRRVNRKMKWQNYKITIVLVVVAIVIVTVIIIVIVAEVKK